MMKSCYCKEKDKEGKHNESIIWHPETIGISILLYIILWEYLFPEILVWRKIN